MENKGYIYIEMQYTCVLVIVDIVTHYSINKHKVLTR